MGGSSSGLDQGEGVPWVNRLNADKAAAFFWHCRNEMPGDGGKEKTWHKRLLHPHSIKLSPVFWAWCKFRALLLNPVLNTFFNVIKNTSLRR